MTSLQFLASDSQVLVLVLVQVLLVEEEVACAGDSQVLVLALVQVLVEVLDQVLVAEDLVLVEHHSEDEVALYHDRLALSISRHQVPLRWSSQRLVLLDGTALPQRSQEAGQAVVAEQLVVTFASLPRTAISASQIQKQEIDA